MTDSLRNRLLAAIDRDRDEALAFLQEVCRRPGENPPGDTRAVAEFVVERLTAAGVEHRVVAPKSEWPNVIATIRGSRPGKRLIFNAHMDHFPAGDPALWSHNPYGAEIVDGQVYGRGVSDNKNGIAGFLYVACLLQSFREELAGEIVATFVSDEETFGPYGTRYLMEHCPEVIGDAVLSAEHSWGSHMRFGEKGLIWLKLFVETAGGHAAYSHLVPNAAQVAARIIDEAGREIHGWRVPVREDLARYVVERPDEVGPFISEGASSPLFAASMNVGVVEGGLKMNMIASSCVAEIDFRVPIGATCAAIIERFDAIVRRHAGARWELVYKTEPNANRIDDPFFDVVAKNITEVRGAPPRREIGLGMTDVRLWRERGVPGAVYGPLANNMGSAPDENISVQDYVDQIKVHGLTAVDFLAGPPR